MILPAYPAYCVYNIHARCQTLENKPSHANISMYPWNKIEHQESAVSSASPSSKSFQRTSGSRIGSSCAASHILCKVRVRIESMRQSWFILISDAYAVQRQNGKQNGSGLISGLVMISLNSSWSWAHLSNMSSTQRFAWWSSWISLSTSRLWEILVDVWCILMHVDAFWRILMHFGTSLEHTCISSPCLSCFTFRPSFEDSIPGFIRCCKESPHLLRVQHSVPLLAQRTACNSTKVKSNAGYA